ncbi:DUF3611 family protein [Nostoc sp. TCL26-01]|uniref:DUF3611 family protein n=1 Tax=Nostoc sp. TCL26-01 TaxID=2576904 RepID=UPI0015B8B852|nr:DUF3611 family protein [Nostoc sp. TCL26-01]QLE59313.1 DUF3611 family protein [Nostoc sp. TCL26-01]
MEAETDTHSNTARHNLSLAPSLYGIANTIRLTGWITLWVQLALAVVALLTLLFALTGKSFSNQPSSTLGIGIFWAMCGIVALLFSVYWDFRYTHIGKQLANPNPALHPSKADTIRAVQLGIIVGLLGMLLTLVGASATLGVFIAKSLSQPPGVAITDPNKIIRALDVFVMVANINGIVAHYIGTVASMWLYERVHQH